jgi:hypothetical protein
VRRWFSVRADEADIAPPQRAAWVAQRSDWLNDQLTDRPQLRELAANPLMLTFLTVLAADDSREHLPRFRRDIYREFERTLFHKWEAQRSAGSRSVGVSPRGAIQALHETALVLHEAYYPVDAAPTVRAAHDDVVMAVARGLAAAEDPRAHECRPSPRVQDEAEAAIEFWQQAGLLRPTGAIGGAQQFLFVHQTFQEYGASCAIAAAFADDPEGLRAYMKPRLSAAGWSEVLPLTLAGLRDYHVDVSGVLTDWRAGIDNRELLNRLPLRQDHQWFADPVRLLLAYSISEGAIVGDAWLNDTLQWLAGQGTSDDAFRALVTVGWSHTAEVLPLLRQMMKDDNPPVRVRAAEATGRLSKGGERREALLVLRRFAGDPAAHPAWRVIAAWSMARLGASDEAVMLLHRFVGQAARAGGATALRVVPALGEIGTPEAVRLLKEIGGRRLPLGAEAAVSAAVVLHRLGHGDEACRLLAALDRIPLLTPDRDRLYAARRDLRCPGAA